ncbi:uncharacterized protein LOC127122253 [Lathyrus oleraceus]|uniref:uncharacterized protein LOC127122253 n=1 Tax=Pisum sativum TaxID=3888 RepID=UPI0021CF2556|nr:uncharacterized protein LOC127122253 [Pisum sativum]
MKGLCSNNKAEYEALIAKLEILLELGATRVEIMGDSELVIKQITKEYKCVKENLIMYFIMANRLLRRFEMVSIRHIPRLENQVANDLAQIESGFRIRETVTTDQRLVCTGRKMQEFVKEMGFKLLTSTPYFAQANGQIEAENKVVISLIKKHVGKRLRNWHKTLDQVLWARRTSPKEATNSTPFRMTFGHGAVLPVEIYLKSTRIHRHHEIPLESYWNKMLDELVDLDEERLNALELLKRKKKRVEESYNKKVKVKTFSPEDLVWKVILPMDRKDKALGKWSPKWECPFQILQVFSNGAYEIEELNKAKRVLRMNGKYLKKYKPTLQEIKTINE